MSPARHVSEPFLDEAKALACIHCGLCLSSCPTYLETGNENDSPRGRIYLMRGLQSGRLGLEPLVVGHLDQCLGCRACEAACPSGVQYGELLEATREHIENHYARPPRQRFLRKILIEQIFPFPHRLRLLLLPARWLRRFPSLRWLPRFAREALALIPQDIPASRIPEFSPATERQGRVGLVSGCVMSVLFGRTHEATVKLLNRAGFDVITPSAQGCCGALYAHNGNLDRARECARHNIAIFETLDLSAIIINAAGCGSTLKEYGHLLKNDPIWAERASMFSAKVKDLSEWLVAHPSAFPDAWTKVLAGNGPDNAVAVAKVTCHDACHLAHAQRITQAPRQLIQAQIGNEFVELPESDVCCGSAGSYNLTEPELAARLQRRKIENILRSGAEIVVTTNPGCLLQIQSGLRAAGAGHVRAVHLADYLWERVEATTENGTTEP